MGFSHITMAKRWHYLLLVSICLIIVVPYLGSNYNYVSKFTPLKLFLNAENPRIDIKQYSNSTKITYDVDFVARRCQLNLSVYRWIKKGLFNLYILSAITIFEA